MKLCERSVKVPFLVGLKKRKGFGCSSPGGSIIYLICRAHRLPIMLTRLCGPVVCVWFLQLLSLSLKGVISLTTQKILFILPHGNVFLLLLLLLLFLKLCGHNLNSPRLHLNCATLYDQAISTYQISSTRLVMVTSEHNTRVSLAYDEDHQNNPIKVTQ